MKLSGVGYGQYLDGWPLGCSKCFRVLLKNQLMFHMEHSRERSEVQERPLYEPFFKGLNSNFLRYPGKLASEPLKVLQWTICSKSVKWGYYVIMEMINIIFADFFLHISEDLNYNSAINQQILLLLESFLWNIHTYIILLK